MELNVLDRLKEDDDIVQNLKVKTFNKSEIRLKKEVNGADSIGNLLFLATSNGCSVYRYDKDSLYEFITLERDKKCLDAICCTNYLVIVIMLNEALSLQFYRIEDILNKIVTKSYSSIEIAKTGPLAIDDKNDRVFIAGTLWSGSWSSNERNSTSNECLERLVRVYRIETMELEEKFEAVKNRIKLLRIDGNQIAIADNLHGVRIFCTNSLKLLYEIEVDEIRNIILVGDYLAVFHKFESNVSLWNSQEKKTILCLNIQDQVKELLDDDDADILLDEDTETSVINLPYEDSGLLLYATRTGNVFGMIVNSRYKLFSISSPFSEEEEKYGLKTLCYIHPGLIVLVSKSLVVLDFNLPK
ncbi:DgyrCDS12971 [Dimorphilus gyrociliatus]|uniref:DgyrCDS12971 n=1 Tax=Dimorphilus gyrociliatus TaxID=2664684 RepID=A0A7I8W9D0_9ANNE|nr:DgyrCDS12971 [Dimorphilus gyrociliatus]